MLNPAAEFLVNALRIVLIDVLLAGDNAVVIALAVKSLPSPQRRTATIIGAGGAIVLRILFTYFAARLLTLPFLKVGGGVLIFWIAIRLLTDSHDDPESTSRAGSMRQAVWAILVADITMSIDNILAVAAASKGNFILLVTGLALSISFVVFMSGYLARLMNRYPVIVWAGAAVLGQVSGSMIGSDPWVSRSLSVSPGAVPWFEVGFALLVVLIGWIVKKAGRKRGLKTSLIKE